MRVNQNQIVSLYCGADIALHRIVGDLGKRRSVKTTRLPEKVSGFFVGEKDVDKEPRLSEDRLS